ncbi:MAG: methionine adenosyltransferase [Bdellovibrionota bacterium]
MFNRNQFFSSSQAAEVSFFTSESVSEGHPDKVADQISDSILDELLTFDPKARVACEALCKTGLVVIAGEITLNNEVVRENEVKLNRKMKSYSDVARSVIKEIGYDDPANGFEYRSCGVIVALDEQSPDIAQGVNEGEGLHKEQGAGDQGMMFGYATNETPEYMPATLQYAHSILSNLSKARKEKVVDWLRPDAKSQVTVEYHNGEIRRVDTVVVSTMHAENVTQEQIKSFVIENIIKKTVPSHLLDSNTKYHINPTGKFVVGGPQGDCGLTGRKIIVDTYGGHGAHGGGAFSGKDPTKVDRSAAYMGRYIAKNIVAAGLADKALVQIAYAIGVAKPVSVNVQTYGTEKVSRVKIENAVKKVFDMTPSGIVKAFDLLHPHKQGFRYAETASYGHFGREKFPWEKMDKVTELKNSI